MIPQESLDLEPQQSPPGGLLATASPVLAGKLELMEA